jgi:single-stranded-DNA-specific exonuclease
MGNEEPVFVSRNVRTTALPLFMKERHVRLRVVQGTTFSAVGWNLAGRIRSMQLAPNSTVDLAWRLRDNDHPEFGGLELEIAGIEHC